MSLIYSCLNVERLNILCDEEYDHFLLRFGHDICLPRHGMLKLHLSLSCENIYHRLYQRKNHCKTTSKNRILTMPCIERSVPFIQRSFWSQSGGFCLYFTYSVHKNISGQQQHSLCLFYWQIPFCSVSGNPRKEWGRCFQWGQSGGAGTSQCHNNTFSRPSRVSTEDSLSLCSSYSWQHQS